MRDNAQIQAQELSLSLVLSPGDTVSSAAQVLSSLGWLTATLLGWEPSTVELRLKQRAVICAVCTGRSHSSTTCYSGTW